MGLPLLDGPSESTPWDNELGRVAEYFQMDVAAAVHHGEDTTMCLGLLGLRSAKYSSADTVEVHTVPGTLREKLEKAVTYMAGTVSKMESPKTVVGEIVQKRRNEGLLGNQNFGQTLAKGEAVTG